MYESANREKLADIFRAQRKILIGLIYRIVGCPHTAEDLVQDAYLRVSDAAVLRDVTHLQPFLFQTARNLALDHVRRNRIRRGFMADGVDDQMMENVAARQPTQETACIDAERLAAVEQTLAHLPDRAKRAFIMSRLEGLSHAAIAARLGVSPSTVYHDLRMALSACVAALGDDSDK